MGSITFGSAANFDATSPLWEPFFTQSNGYQETSYSSTSWALTGLAASGYANYKVVFAGVFSRPPAGGIPNGTVTGFTVYDPSGIEMYKGAYFSQPVSQVISNPAILLDQPGGSLSVQLTEGNDLFVGGPASAIIIASGGTDTIVGGSGGATINFSRSTVGINIDLSLSGPQNTGMGQLILQDVTGVFGSGYADIITGSVKDDYLASGGGSDRIFGGNGNDRISVSNPYEEARGTVAYGGDGNDDFTVFNDGTLYGEDGNDIFTVGYLPLIRGYINGEGNTIDGGSGNDLFLGWESGNTLIGGTGSDTFIFRGSTVSDIGKSVIDGGDDYDALDFDIGRVSQARLISIYLGGGAQDGPGVIDARNVEELRVSAGTGSNVYGAGPATVFVYGGTENDIVKSSGPTGLTIDGGGGNDWLSGSEAADMISAGGGADTLFGNGGDDTLRSGNGIDIVDGGVGNDILILFGTSTSYDVKLVNGLYYLLGVSQHILVSNVETIRFDDGIATWQSVTDRATPFDGLRYIASYPDLIRAFGDDPDAATQHFITHGFTEGRMVTFDPLAYSAASPDLARAFGDDAAALERHYINFGLAEGRQTSGFDSVAYLLSYRDLAGMTPAQAASHWLTFGADEGRAGDGLFGREQNSHDMRADRAVTAVLDTNGDRDWFSFGTTPGFLVDVHLSAEAGSNAILTGGRIEIFDATGHLVASTSASSGQTELDLFFQSAPDQPALYYVAIDSATGTTGDYALSLSGTFNASM